jgi:hypothetical protein
MRVLKAFALLSALISAARLHAADMDSSQYIRRVYEIDITLISYQPGEGIEAYENLGSGMATQGSTIGNQIRIDGVLAEVAVRPRLEKKRFLVAVYIEPENASRSLGFEKQTFDMTDLKPAAIRLATGKTGRVYQLNLDPKVQITDNTPRKLDVNNLALQDWRFPNSPILVNDAFYVGEIACAHSPVAFVDISGVARVEFSLYELTNAKPWGALNRGVVTLTNPEDHTTIKISNVSNGGSEAIELPGGPYRVWVRWSKPTYTIDEFRQEMAKQRKQLLDGDNTKAYAEYLEKQLARAPSPWLSSSGIRGLEHGDRVDEKKRKNEQKTGAAKRSLGVVADAGTSEN